MLQCCSPVTRASNSHLQVISLMMTVFQAILFAKNEILRNLYLADHEERQLESRSSVSTFVRDEIELNRIDCRLSVVGFSALQIH